MVVLWYTLFGTCVSVLVGLFVTVAPVLVDIAKGDYVEWRSRSRQFVLTHSSERPKG